MWLIPWGLTLALAEPPDAPDVRLAAALEQIAPSGKRILLLPTSAEALVRLRTSALPDNVELDQRVANAPIEAERLAAWEGCVYRAQLAGEVWSFIALNGCELPRGAPAPSGVVLGPARTVTRSAPAASMSAPVASDPKPEPSTSEPAVVPNSPSGASGGTSPARGGGEIAVPLTSAAPESEVSPPVAVPEPAVAAPTPVPRPNPLLLVLHRDPTAPGGWWVDGAGRSDPLSTLQFAELINEEQVIRDLRRDRKRVEGPRIGAGALGAASLVAGLVVLGAVGPSVVVPREPLPLDYADLENYQHALDRWEISQASADERDELMTDGAVFLAFSGLCWSMVPLIGGDVTQRIRHPGLTWTLERAESAVEDYNALIRATLNLSPTGVQLTVVTP